MATNKNQTYDQEARLLKLLGLTKAEMEARVKAIFVEARKKAFGPPYDDVWGDDDWEDADDADGQLETVIASEIESKPIDIPPDDDPLMIAARQQWPKSDKKYLAMIVHRYRDMYAGIPLADAVRCIREGYSSPAHAMSARRLKRRPLRDRAL